MSDYVHTKAVMYPVTEENPVDDFVCSECGLHLHDWMRERNEDYYEKDGE